jgi:hypothetical protein
MTLKRLVVGILGLSLAVIWSMSLLYQQHAIDSFVRLLMSPRVPLFLRFSSLWSLGGFALAALLVVPVVGASIAVMLGTQPAARMLRVMAVVSGVAGFGTLLIYASLALPRVLSGKSFLLGNTQVNYELLAAVCALAVQMTLLVLLRTSGTDDTRRDLAWVPAPDRAVDAEPPPSSHDSQLSGLSRA